MKRPQTIRAGWRAVLVALLVPVLLAAAPPREINTAQPVVLPAKTTTRSAAIAEIQKQTAYKVAFDRKVYDDGKSVDFGKKELPLGEVMNKLLAGSGNGYMFDGKYIIIHRTAAGTASQVAVMTTRSMTGTVTDAATGAALENVRVEVLETGAAAATNQFGRFALQGLTPGDYVVKTTAADGKIHYRTVVVPTGKDAEVAFALNGDVMKSAEQDITRLAVPERKTTAYYRPMTEDDYTVRAFSGEARNEYTYVPYSKINTEYRPKLAVSTNLLLYGLLAPNVDLDWALARKWTMGAGVAYNPFSFGEESSTRFWVARLKADYWFCNRFEKFHIGLHGLYGRFNVGNVNLPLTDAFDDYRYKGWGAGGGIHAGYHIPMGKRWGWDFRLGVGYVYLEYDKYQCEGCDRYLGRYNRHYFGVTDAAISLIFFIK